MAAKTKHLSLNIQKTNLMLFNRKRKHIHEFSLIIIGKDIQCVASFNVYGIMLDENLSWKKHI